MDLKPRKQPPKIITTRTHKNLDTEKFKLDLQNVPWSTCDILKMLMANIQYGLIYSKAYTLNMRQEGKLSFGDKRCHGWVEH